MSDYTASMFGNTVMTDFSVRRSSGGVVKESLRASAALETKALGHPTFENLRVGERLTAPMVVAFIDLTDFTGRSFWEPRPHNPAQEPLSPAGAVLGAGAICRSRRVKLSGFAWGTLDAMGFLSPGRAGDPHGEVFAVAGGNGVLSLRPDGILHLIWAPSTYVQEEDAVSAVTMMNTISPDHDRPLLVDMRNAGNTSSRARDVFARPHSVSRVALLGESPVDQVIASFFTGVHRPRRPTRYFTSEAKALSWLSGG